MSNLPIDSMDRAPSHHKPAIPRASEIAERLANGEPIETIAAGCERTVATLRGHLAQRGYDSVTGLPVARPRLSLTPVRLNEQPWAEDALCAQTDPEAFFPEPGGSLQPAKAICRRCEVRPECLTYALDNDIRWGLWGGVGERERLKMRKQRRAS